MLATVVSADGQRVTIDAGNKTLTSTTTPGYGSGRMMSACPAWRARS
jgi:hypothetical protein